MTHDTREIRRSQTPEGQAKATRDRKFVEAAERYTEREFQLGALDDLANAIAAAQAEYERQAPK